jgi:hypothetical protein
MVLFTTKFLDVAKFTTLTPLLLLHGSTALDVYLFCHLLAWYYMVISLVNSKQITLCMYLPSGETVVDVNYFTHYALYDLARARWIGCGRKWRQKAFMLQI